jgi:hypothetical protein
METRTKNLIDRLSEMSSREEIEDEVIYSHEELTQSLRERGFEFEQDTDNFRGGQSLTNQHDLADYYYYSELNFIKKGLEDDWVANIDDYENYKAIEDQINDIIIEYD